MAELNCLLMIQLAHHLDPTIAPRARLIALNRGQLPAKSPTGG
jgi:hypothetical protein